MSAPDPGPDPEDDAPGNAEAGRRSARPLVWLLLVIALLALLWYVSRDTQPGAEPVPVEPPAAVSDPEDDSAEEPDEEDAGPAPAPVRTAAPTIDAEDVPDDRAAEPVSRVQPEYPAEALRTREEGTVLLRVEVDAQGNAASVEIERSSRSRELDRAARDAVSRWTFRPAIEDGKPVPSTVTVPVDFRVE